MISRPLLNNTPLRCSAPIIFEGKTFCVVGEEDNFVYLCASAPDKVTYLPWREPTKLPGLPTGHLMSLRLNQYLRVLNNPDALVSQKRSSYAEKLVHSGKPSKRDKV